MKIKLFEISELDFKALSVPILFNDDSSDRVFGLISDNKNKYKLGWQSDVIKPVIKWINSNICSIGIDQKFIIFEFDTGKVLLKTQLDYFFFDTLILNDSVYIITELELIKIKIKDFFIQESYALPDYFESIRIEKDSIIVKCVDSQVININ
ncbi:MAG TPA: hypothetical protein PLE30_11250 [Candidatus Kapabacteria bacterium]|nr:hypothetical protein [Candidatus Kapabacteria bacterium]